jgi:predicted RNA-binding Zn-ribbon protein involved in translation (DUF1610 family)
MTKTEKMKCPACGSRMNHHADKVIYGGLDDGVFPGNIEELHQCPACGEAASRPEGSR